LKRGRITLKIVFSNGKELMSTKTGRQDSESPVRSSSSVGCSVYYRTDSQ
jgi:hypothetical protein